MRVRIIGALAVVCALAITLMFTPAAVAQTVAVAQLSGRVTDDSGAAIPGVELTVTQTDTGSARTAITDERGEYSLPSLPVGPYKLTAKLPGFSTFDPSTSYCMMALMMAVASVA